MKPRRIFLSHSSRDGRFAGKVVETLRSHGLKVWFSPRHIVGAQQWHDEIGKALRRCDWFLIILSRKAVQSEWVRRELQFALWDKRYHRKVVPLLLEDCNYTELSWVLPTIQHVDFRFESNTGYRALLRIWGIKFLKPLSAKKQATSLRPTKKRT